FFGQRFPGIENTKNVIQIRARGTGDIAGRWGQQSAKYKKLTDNFQWFVFYWDDIGNYNMVIDVTDYAEIDKLQLERGNKATDYSPAPEDIFAGLDSKADLDNVYVKSDIDGMFDNVVSQEAYLVDKDGFIE